jgi:penicillin-binding protein 1A
MKTLLKITKFFLILSILGVISAAGIIFGVYQYVKPDLPSIENLKHVQLQVPLRIYSKDGLLISEYGEKRRIPVTFEQVPEQLVQAFLAAEDDRFYEHPGVDYQGLVRAAIQLALTGQKKQGGSTITMQVARNFFLSSKKTYLRKINEIFLALKIDKDLSKNEVLTLYMNKIYLGHRAYGVGAAARVYYGKDLDELDLAQIAMIAGLPKAPSKYNPITDPERAVIRRNYVLDRMLSLGFITAEQEKTARNAAVTAKRYSANIELNAPYIAEMARSEMFQRYGEESYSGGYSVYTTVVSDLQQQAIDAVHMVSNDYDRRHGYRGVIAELDATVITTPEKMDETISDTETYGNLAVAIATEVKEQEVEIYLGNGQSATIPWNGLKWARRYITEDRRGKSPKKAGDILKPASLVYVLRQTEVDKKSKDKTPVTFWRLAQIPDVNAALVALDPKNGAITSLVGGYDYFQTKFNRITQAKRQPGSGFKAFIYSAALENGFTAASTINDAPVVFQDAGLEGAWRPENYSGKFFGLTRLRYALTKSRNLVSVRLLRSIGIKNALDHIENFGFSREELPHNLSLALGSANITPLQMARGYAVLANGGFLVDPYVISRIEKNGSEIIYQATPRTVCEKCPEETPKDPTNISATNPTDQPEAETETPLEPAPRVISAENRYIMYSMMQDVITRGTGTKAKVLKRRDLAGKTGTTNDQRDAWFNGYNQSIVATAWVGFDDNSKLGNGEFGGRAALPGWIHYMKKALTYYPQDKVPVMPDGMLSIRIDPRTGKLASINQRDAIFEVFRAEYAPTEKNEQAALPANDSSTPQTIIEDTELF